MTEKYPLWDEIGVFELTILSLENGVKALGVTVAELVDKNPEIDISAVYFVECGLQAVHADLKAKWDALNEARGRAEA